MKRSPRDNRYKALSIQYTMKFFGYNVSRETSKENGLSGLICTGGVLVGDIFKLIYSANHGCDIR
ncbi:hypothetical protein KDW_19490 [Dictyobacter vulcani]|uniref:Uncharacterized protein n=1 Tax=Dictyobacter vulcani TaxID=2607529 RepID=A0A5J4KMX7_9CHLR|nr:hypothetical protein KDW_19490 [Dictyobacter vulcani]